ncbi:MAG: urease accessory protein UreE [Rhizobacter sp.]|nr:urease accessory protein UreE [Ferruginibacter sp.]
MIISKKLGKLDNLSGDGIDIVWLYWYETNKRILHQQTVSGKNISLRFLNENPAFETGDILYQDETTTIVIDIFPAEAIVIKPSDMFEMASICYEIGNKHLPLFFEQDALLVPYEAAFYKYLLASGYKICIENRKLQHPLRTTVSPHSIGSGETLFSKIMKLTTDKK